MKRIAIVAALVFVGAAGCGDPEADDAGTGFDSGVVQDSGRASPDAGPDTPDGGDSDSGGSDAGPGDDSGVDGGAADAGPTPTPDGGTCNPSAVRFVFLASGPLEEGTLCDDVFVCLADSAEAARVMAASSRFDCSGGPEAPCPGGTCAYRGPGGPGILDAAELAEICAVTLVSPTPDVVCAVYGP